jgi:hypothetical protein
MKNLKLLASLLIVSAALAMPVQASIKQDNEIISRHQQAVGDYAKRNGLVVPEIQPYAYGMKLDVARLVRISPDDKKACKPIPQLMTYQDSSGALKTVQYRVFSECRNNN